MLPPPRDQRSLDIINAVSPGVAPTVPGDWPFACGIGCATAFGALGGGAPAFLLHRNIVGAGCDAHRYVVHGTHCSRRLSKSDAVSEDEREC